MYQPDLDLLTSLANSGLGLTPGTNLFAGPTLPVGDSVPALSVFVLTTGGYSPTYLMGSQADFCTSSVQITIRSAPESFAAGQLLAGQVRLAVHHRGIMGYVDIRTTTADPIYIGPDESGDHLWTINVDLIYRR